MPRVRLLAPTMIAMILLTWLIGPIGASEAEAATPSGVAALAAANIGKGAGSCSTYNASPNSLGGTSFLGSCNGGGELWCADFVKWVWANSGLNVAGLTAAAGSFLTQSGLNGSVVHRDGSYVPQPGDAIVFSSGGAIAHVGIVTSLGADGSIVTVNGDFNGTGSDDRTFARTARVTQNAVARSSRGVGSTALGMTITAYVTPSGFTAGSSGAASSGSNAYAVAFQANTASLYSYWSSGRSDDQRLGMMAGTSPSITTLTSGGSEIAFQANTGNLWVTGDAGAADTRQGMMPGTSPAIAATPSGRYKVAFQANTTDLYTYSPDAGATNQRLGMMAGTSPSITTLTSGGSEIAFQANTGNLWVTGDAGAADTRQGMMPGTSPAIAATPSGGFVVLFQANTGSLYLYESTGASRSLGLGMAHGTSPCVNSGAATGCAPGGIAPTTAGPAQDAPQSASATATANANAPAMPQSSFSTPVAESASPAPAASAPASAGDPSQSAPPSVAPPTGVSRSVRCVSVGKRWLSSVSALETRAARSQRASGATGSCFVHVTHAPRPDRHRRHASLQLFVVGEHVTDLGRRIHLVAAWRWRSHR